jgi:hypothetical protein
MRKKATEVGEDCSKRQMLFFKLPLFYQVKGCMNKIQTDQQMSYLIVIRVVNKEHLLKSIILLSICLREE